LRSLGLTNQQFSLLMALNRPEPPTMAPVARLLAMDRTTLTAALRLLERRNLLSVQADPADRRSRLLRLTKAGHKLLLDALPIWRQTHAEIAAEKPALDLNDLRASLRLLA